MNASKFTETQKVFILKQGAQVAEMCRKAGISQAIYFSWKKKFDGLLPDEIRRLKALEEENVRLKKIVCDLTLDREMLRDVIRRRLFARDLHRDVCRLGRINPGSLWGQPLETSTYHYKFPAHGPRCCRKADQGNS